MNSRACGTNHNIIGNDDGTDGGTTVMNVTYMVTHRVNLTGDKMVQPRQSTTRAITLIVPAHGRVMTLSCGMKDDQEDWMVTDARQPSKCLNICCHGHQGFEGNGSSPAPAGEGKTVRSTHP